ncbi:serpin-ZX-like [Vicia villosa]|uniref:serpin-ZX-like n=1 Tax=Vicia villosa TaxID=3911 RepID=UPI00273AB602|nr:serpin-ZX-like [Vicia villosa]
MDLGKSSTNQTEVSLTMAKHLFSKEEYKEKNIVFSPLSLQIILSIVAVGSQGSTKHQLLEFLHSDSTGKLKTLCSQLVSYVLADNSSAGGPLVSFVNGVWVQQSSSLKPSFKKSVSTDFKAAIASVDFITKAHEVAKEVNLWDEKETKGLIKNLLPPESVDSLTRLILANALYFKGAWRTEFDISKTKDYDFYLLNGSSVKVPFMTSKDKQYISVFDGFKVLQLSYKGGQSFKHKDRRSFSMYIYLPDAKDGLLALIEKVASDYEFLEHTRPRNSVPVGDFRIPRFNISFDLETSRMLKELGVVLPFSETGGGLTKMVEDSPEGKELYVSAIYHKSYIELNERGTEAAAVNFFTMRATCARFRKPSPPPIDFVADHPFMFLIRENCSGTILFIGQVLNPGKNKVRNKVNLWAEKETKGLIKNLLPPGAVDSLTKLIFANALYFKGAWRAEFDISKTKDYDFYLLNGSSVKVPFMTSKQRQFISVFDGFKVLQLFYKGGKSYNRRDRPNFSIYLYLPDAKDGLLALIEKVASDSEFLEHTCPRNSVPVGDFRIPRFNISFDLETSSMLKELGVVLPFSEAGGGLTKMVEDSPIGEKLYVSAIYHKSYIVVNERGTEAAAATSTGLRGTGCRHFKPLPPPIDFVADHPFMFFIRENCSGTILFIGQVLNPGVSENSLLPQKQSQQNSNKRLRYRSQQTLYKRRQY